MATPALDAMPVLCVSARAVRRRLSGEGLEGCLVVAVTEPLLVDLHRQGDEALLARRVRVNTTAFAIVVVIPGRVGQRLGGVPQALRPVSHVAELILPLLLHIPGQHTYAPLCPQKLPRALREC